MGYLFNLNFQFYFINFINCIKLILEPHLRLELKTFCLQGKRSTAELKGQTI